MHIPSNYEVETFGGKFVDVAHPDPATINLTDIAHALSQVCRFGGHCKKFYSVAEHSVFVSMRMERKGHSRLEQLAALHHDDAEAYLGDIPRPMKPLLGRRYEWMTGRMDVAIIAALGLPFKAADLHTAAIKEADNWSLFVEARHLLPSQGKGWWDGEQGAYKWNIGDMPSRIITPDYFRSGLSPLEAEVRFQMHHEALTKED